MEMIKGATVLTYEDHVVYPYNYYHTYHKDDCVEYDGMIFKSIRDFNSKCSPIESTFSWEEVGKIINRSQHYEEDDILVKDWKKDKLYTQYDKVKYQGFIYTCEAGRLEGSTPPPESIWWTRCGSYNDNSDKKSTTVKVNNDKVGDITGDNIVIYGNHTGDISANGEKSVVVVFGNVSGDITANQVIRLDKQNTEAGKHLMTGMGD